jgi:hypothetical protein
VFHFRGDRVIPATGPQDVSELSSMILGCSLSALAPSNEGNDISDFQLEPFFDGRRDSQGPGIAKRWSIGSSENFVPLRYPTQRRRCTKTDQPSARCQWQSLQLWFSCRSRWYGHASLPFYPYCRCDCITIDNRSECFCSCKSEKTRYVSSSECFPQLFKVL